jgi:hypothetical protein
MKELPLISAAFGQKLAPRVYELCRSRPGLLGQLAGYTTRDFHAVAAWLGLREPGDPDDDAAHVWKTSPKDLLKEALPGHSPMLWRLFSKLPSVAFQNPKAYSRLADLTCGPVASLLKSAQRIAQVEITFYEELAALLEHEPLLIPAAKGLWGCGPTGANTIVAAFGLLRAHDAIGMESEFVAALENARDFMGLCRIIMRKLSQIEVASPGPLENSRLTPVRSMKALAEVGRRFRNCLGHPNNRSFVEPMLKGECWFYEWCGPVPALICLDVIGPGLVHIRELKGHKNAEIKAQVRQEIVQELNAMGLRVSPVSMGELFREFVFEEDEFEGLKAFQTLLEEYEALDG